MADLSSRKTLSRRDKMRLLGKANSKKTDLPSVAPQEVFEELPTNNTEANQPQTLNASCMINEISGGLGQIQFENKPQTQVPKTEESLGEESKSDHHHRRQVSIAQYFSVAEINEEGKMNHIDQALPIQEDNTTQQQMGEQFDQQIYLESESSSLYQLEQCSSPVQLSKQKIQLFEAQFISSSRHKGATTQSIDPEQAEINELFTLQNKFKPSQADAIAKGQAQLSTTSLPQKIFIINSKKYQSNQSIKTIKSDQSISKIGNLSKISDNRWSRMTISQDDIQDSIEMKNWSRMTISLDDIQDSIEMKSWSRKTIQNNSNDAIEANLIANQGDEQSSDEEKEHHFEHLEDSQGSEQPKASHGFRYKQNAEDIDSQKFMPSSEKSSNSSISSEQLLSQIQDVKQQENQLSEMSEEVNKQYVSIAQVLKKEEKLSVALFSSLTVSDKVQFFDNMTAVNNQNDLSHDDKCALSVEGICDENSKEDIGHDDPNDTAKFCQFLRYETFVENKILEQQSEEDIYSNDPSIISHSRREHLSNSDEDDQVEACNFSSEISMNLPPVPYHKKERSNPFAQLQDPIDNDNSPIKQYPRAGTETVLTTELKHSSRVATEKALREQRRRSSQSRQSMKRSSFGMSSFANKPSLRPFIIAQSVLFPEPHKMTERQKRISETVFKSILLEPQGLRASIQSIKQSFASNREIRSRSSPQKDCRTHPEIFSESQQALSESLSYRSSILNIIPSNNSDKTSDISDSLELQSEHSSISQDENFQRSDTSTVRDGSMILNHSFCSQEDFLQDVKRNALGQRFTKQSDQQHQLPVTTQASVSRVKLQKQQIEDYDSYDGSIKRLKKGFYATKFNFSNDHIRKVKIFLSQDEKWLYYKHQDNNVLSSLITPYRKIKISAIPNFLYGGLSGTFQKHSDENLGFLKQNQQKEQHVNQDYFKRGYPLRIKQEGQETIEEENKQETQPAEQIRPNQEQRLQKNYQQTKSRKCIEHYSWECISIFREQCYSTLDFVIPDYRNMMALLHVLHQRVFKPTNQKFLLAYKKQKFQQKLQFQAWHRTITVGTLIKFGILKTLQQKLRLVSQKLKIMVNDKEFNGQHRLFSPDNQSFEVTRSTPNFRRLVSHLHIFKHSVSSKSIDQFFTEETHKLKFRKQIDGAKGEAFATGAQLHPATTYGNLLYEFCSYSLSLKSFQHEQRWQAGVNSLISVVWDAAKCLGSKGTVLIDDVFYRDKRQKKLQKEMMINITQEIEKGIYQKGYLDQEFGQEVKKAYREDFNFFILNDKMKAIPGRAKFMEDHMHFMTQMSRLHIKLCKLRLLQIKEFYHPRFNEIRKLYQEKRASLIGESEITRKLMIRLRKEIKFENSLDLPKFELRNMSKVRLINMWSNFMLDELCQFNEDFFYKDFEKAASAVFLFKSGQRNKQLLKILKEEQLAQQHESLNLINKNEKVQKFVNSRKSKLQQEHEVTLIKESHVKVIENCFILIPKQEHIAAKPKIYQQQRQKQQLQHGNF